MDTDEWLTSIIVTDFRRIPHRSTPSRILLFRHRRVLPLASLGPCSAPASTLGRHHRPPRHPIHHHRRRIHRGDCERTPSCARRPRPRHQQAAPAHRVVDGGTTATLDPVSELRLHGRQRLLYVLRDQVPLGGRRPGRQLRALARRRLQPRPQRALRHLWQHTPERRGHQVRHSWRRALGRGKWLSFPYSRLMRRNAFLPESEEEKDILPKSRWGRRQNVGGK